MQTPFGGSKFKNVPYLFVHSRHTEGTFYDGRYGELDPRGSGTYSNTVSYVYTYDEYVTGTVDGYSAGPHLQYRWRMNGSGDLANDVSAAEYGIGTLSLTGNLTSFHSTGTGFVTTTYDFQHIYWTGGYTGWYALHDVSWDRNSLITVGGWWQFDTTLAEQQVLWTSDRGGFSGKFRGAYLYYPGNGKIQLIFGDSGLSLNGSSTYYVQTSGTFRYETKNTPVIIGEPNLIIAKINPQSKTPRIAYVAGYGSHAFSETTLFEHLVVSLYINGIEQELTTTNVSNFRGVIRWDSNPSDVGGYDGMSLWNNQDTVGLQANARLDEFFIHKGDINAEQIARMYELGTQ